MLQSMRRMVSDLFKWREFGALLEVPSDVLDKINLGTSSECTV